MLEFSTSQEMESHASGILDEALMADSAGSPASGVNCGPESSETENFTRPGYYEHAAMSGLFMTDRLSYHSAGRIGQGDTEQPDSLAMDISSTGYGAGIISADSVSITGIGNTSELCYVHSVHEETRAGGMFAMKGRVNWSSFTSST